MKVQIENNIFLESDGLQFVIKEYTGKRDNLGRDIFRIHGYFSTVEQALEHLVKMKISESTATTLCELVQDINSIRQYIVSKLSA